MKRIFTIIIIVVITIYSFGQIPQKISYQTVIQDVGNSPVKSQAVGIRISIIQGSERGKVVYTETQTTITSPDGLVSIKIGGGTGFNEIDWTDGPYFIKTETDPTGGTSYTIKNTSKLLRVPYEMQSKIAARHSETGHAFIATGIASNKNDLAVNPDTVNIASNLPLVLINTNGQTIVDGTKIVANMKIIDYYPSHLNHVIDSANGYNGKIAIELRGSYSLYFPQKGYGLETRDSLNVQQNVIILGMPSENDWILEQHYNDKALMRNELSYQLSNNMGHYASRTRYCEMFLNNNYMGIYFFGEKIRRDKNRVSIAKLTPDDNSGDKLTGGYIFKNDNGATGEWYSNFSEIGAPGIREVQFIFFDPKSDDLIPQQKSYIETFINSFETALYGYDFRDPVKGYLPFINMRSFVDYFILGEFTRNVDTYKKSRYLYKERDSRGGLLYSGPAWDFDWAYKDMPGQAPSYSATDGSGWVYAIPAPHSPPYPGWAPRMMQDSNFVNALRTRYVELRKTVLDTTNIFHYMDSIHDLVNQAQVRHYIKWPILGVVSIGAPEVEPQPATFDAAVLQMKKWITTRLAWLDENMEGSVLSAQEVQTIISDSEFRVFPNPASDHVYIESDKIILQVEIYSTTGQLLKIIPTKAYSLPVDLSGLRKGLFFLRVFLETGEIQSRKLIIE